MKKLMITAAAALTATIGFSVESSNVVGYQSAGLQQYGLTAGAAFIPVSGSTFDLTQLKITGYDTAEGTEGDVYVQTLDEYGRTVATYTFYDVPGEFFGWFDDAEAEVTVGDVTFQAGEGLWTFSSGDGFGFQSAGQVPTSGIVVMLQQYGLSVANPTPVDVDLTDTYIGGYDAAEGTEGDVYVQTLDEYGRTVASYTFYDVPGEVLGWFDDAEAEVNKGDVVLNPGIGLWTFSSADGFTFVFPGVTL